MHFQPLVARELRVCSRRQAFYWYRVALPVIGFFFLLRAPELVATKFPAFGHSLFSGLSWTMFYLCLGCGAWMTFDCVSAEKREGTIGFLFLSNLRTGDVVLGKLSAYAFSGIIGILSMVPILSLTLLLGG